jgi:hypothetical protein
LELRKPRNGRQIKAGRPKPNADGHLSAMADFCNKIGLKPTSGDVRFHAAVKGIADMDSVLIRSAPIY